jgi:hypothetical protein
MVEKSVVSRKAFRGSQAKPENCHATYPIGTGIEDEVAVDCHIKHIIALKTRWAEV